MDAPRGSVEFEQADELERLRRRAYGPEADIAGDAAAQARLSQLEAAQRQPTTVGDVGTGVLAPIPGRVLVAETVEASRSASASVPQPVGGAFAHREPAGTSVIEQYPATGSSADSDAIARAPAVPWWRRRRSLVIGGGVIAVLALNVAVTASVSHLLADQSTPIPAETATEETPPVRSGQGGGSYEPAPDHVLALRSDGAAADQPEDPGGKLDALGISPDELKRYEDFQSPVGRLSVWSGESRYGMTCLLMAAFGQPISDGGRAAEGCSLNGADTIADIGGSDSRTRLVLKGDHVDVYVYEGGADPNSS